MLRGNSGSIQHSFSRQILAAATRLNLNEEGGGESVLDDRDVVAELKKAVLRWTVYLFPIRYKMTYFEGKTLKKLPRWFQLPLSENSVRDTEYAIKFVQRRAAPLGNEAHSARRSNRYPLDDENETA